MITENSRGDFQSPETEVMGKAMMQKSQTRNEFGVANE